MSKLSNNRMSNFTPPHCENVEYVGNRTAQRQKRCTRFVCIAFVVLAALAVAYAGYRHARTEIDYYTVRYNPAIFENRDSLLHYARLAYLEDDADALGITGTAAFFYYNDPAARDTLPVVSTDEGAIMLLRSAKKGNTKSRYVIDCLIYQGLWDHCLPEELNTEIN